MQTPEHERAILTLRGTIYLIVLCAGLLLVALTTFEYGGGFLLIRFVWMFPVGVIQIFGVSSILGWPLISGYAVYITVWVTILRSQRAEVIKVMLALHILIVLLTVGGCHRHISGLPH